MRALTIEDLNAAAHVGGASSLVMRQELEPASGPDGVIAPAKYVDSNGNATYIIEKRYMEGEENPAKVVLIDSKTSFANRAEATTTEAMRNGEGILSKMPHIAVEYDVDDGKNVFYDNRLNHTRMHEILRWRICFRCLICLRKPSSLVVGIRRVVRIS